jgi:hypothetical protein
VLHIRCRPHGCVDGTEQRADLAWAFRRQVDGNALYHASSVPNGWSARKERHPSGRQG